jgi:hypothetical protein
MLSVPRDLTILLASFASRTGRGGSGLCETQAACDGRTILEPLALVGDEHLPPRNAPEDVVEGFLSREGKSSTSVMAHRRETAGVAHVGDRLVRRDDAVATIAREGSSSAITVVGLERGLPDAHFEPSVAASSTVAVEKLVVLDDAPAVLVAVVCGRRDAGSERAVYTETGRGGRRTGRDADVRDPLLKFAHPVCRKRRDRSAP